MNKNWALTIHYEASLSTLFLMSGYVNKMMIAPAFMMKLNFSKTEPKKFIRLFSIHEFIQLYRFEQYGNVNIPFVWVINRKRIQQDYLALSLKRFILKYVPFASCKHTQSLATIMVEVVSLAFFYWSKKLCPLLSNQLDHLYVWPAMWCTTFIQEYNTAIFLLNHLSFPITT